MSAEPRVTITVRDHGPLLVEGEVVIQDAEGHRFARAADKPVVALCRCGSSANKPFCDGAHNRMGFQAKDRASTSE